MFKQQPALLVQIQWRLLNNICNIGQTGFIGNQGKKVGLGPQDNLHSKVPIVLPLAVIVESFTVKAGQGNTPKDGDAQLFKDGATSAGQLVTNDVCELNSSPSDR